jgi:hypothetical protein
LLWPNVEQEEAPRRRRVRRLRRRWRAERRRRWRSDAVADDIILSPHHGQIKNQDGDFVTSLESR